MTRVSLLAVVIVVVACGRQQREEPSKPSVRVASPELARGERLFGMFCYQCHPAGAAGLGPALNDKPLPGIAIRTQIRQGVGAMPAFGDRWLTDAQVDDISTYVQALRDAP